jgi:Phosphotransferase enzyme family
MRTFSSFDRFLILVTRNDASELLLESSPNGARLPGLSIPAKTRLAAEITGAIENRWNLKTYCLFTLAAEDTSDSGASTAVLEAGPFSEPLPDGISWHSLASLAQADFVDPSNSATIERALGTLEQYRRGQLHGPFAQTGWLRRVTDWVEGEGEGIGLRLHGTFRQLNASPTFSLIRFETNGSALWFKAVGQPNLHEYSIIRKLVIDFPQFVPRFVASRAQWNAWLSVEADGTHLCKDSHLRDWQRAATTFAHLQLATFGNALHLIDVGCKDVRPLSLLNHVQPFFDFLAESMDQQTKPSPAPLARQEIQSLAREVKTSLDLLADSDIPSVLGHMDLNPGNILVGESRCVFLDWAEGAVGHPFLSFEYLREYWRKLHGADTAGEKALVCEYTSAWQSFVSPSAIKVALEHTPLVAAFAFAVLDKPWERPESLRYATAPYLRSLTRRMKREADALKQRRAVCVP